MGIDILSSLAGGAAIVMLVCAYKMGERNLKGSESETFTPFLSGVTKQAREMLKTHPKPGIVTRPSQQDIIRKENPKLKEEEDSMREAFEELGIPKK